MRKPYRRDGLVVYGSDREEARALVLWARDEVQWKARTAGKKR